MVSRITKRRVVLALCCTLASFSIAIAQAPPDCQCRDPSGTRRDLGTIECVTITGHAWLVRCEMSTNTPYWNRLRQEEGCSLT